MNNNNNKIPMTIYGLKKLKKKLNFLKNILRPKIIKSIALAREHGDLSENAEYQTAKDEQFLIEQKIKNIEVKLNNAYIIEMKNKNINKIIFGSVIKLLNLKNKKIFTYQIVGKDEANYKENKISYDSPIGKSLLGKCLDEIITINIPLGILKLKILNIS